ncbi:hypothetical protein IH980_04465 [Patescibacteria group bacterium]|nr:hypothetical protein [Patescibacteria group bacterium]
MRVLIAKHTPSLAPPTKPLATHGRAWGTAEQWGFQGGLPLAPTLGRRGCQGAERPPRGETPWKRTSSAREFITGSNSLLPGQKLSHPAFTSAPFDVTDKRSVERIGKQFDVHILGTQYVINSSKKIAARIFFTYSDGTFERKKALYNERHTFSTVKSQRSIDWKPLTLKEGLTRMRQAIPDSVKRRRN